MAIATVVRAQAGPEISVSVDPCVPVERGQLERLLAIELGTSTARGGPAASTHVWVSCGVQGVELRLEDGVTRKSMLRVLPAASFRDASSTRLLALAIAEFVVASWIELRVSPRQVVEPVGPPASPAERNLAEQVVKKRVAAPTGSSRESSVSAAFAVQVWSAHDGVLLGGGLRLLQLAMPALAWTISGDVAAASVDVPLGTVRLTTASVALGGALRLHGGNSAFYTGPGGRLGFIRMLGEPSDSTRNEGRSFFAPHGGVMWWNRAEYRAPDGMLLALELEAGLITIPARALSGTTEVLALKGAWLTTGISLGFAF